MSRATAPPRKKAPPRSKARAVLLTERVRQEKRRVDGEGGIIYDVKVLGHESDNGRRYTPESIKAAVPLYEGRFVNVDHPEKATAARSSLDRTAWLENVRYVEGDGLRGDLHFLLPLDEYQKKVLWAAENKPNAWGLSHNADGKGNEDARGVFVVEAITEVRSVDLVPDPATNRSLFEGKTVPTKITLRELVESLAIPAELNAKKKALLEDEYGDMPVDAPPADAAVDWRATLGRVAGELMASEDAEAHDVAKKIHAMLKPKSAPSSSTETATEAEDDDKDDDEKETKESRKVKKAAPHATTLTEDKAQRLCKLAGVKPDATLLEGLTSSSEEAGLRILEWAKSQQAPPAKGPAVRSQGPVGHRVGATKLPADFDDYLAALRN